VSQLTELFQGCVDPTSPDAALHFCFRARIPCCIFKWGWLKVENDAKFHSFWPSV